MSRLLTSGGGAGARQTGPIMVNPDLLGYSGIELVSPPSRPMNFPKTTLNPNAEPEISDQAVAEAIERLTKSPGSSPDELLQAALDMELVIKHFDSLSLSFGAEAALTSLALDLASKSEREQPKARRVRKAEREQSKARRSRNTIRATAEVD